MKAIFRIRHDGKIVYIGEDLTSGDYVGEVVVSRKSPDEIDE